MPRSCVLRGTLAILLSAPVLWCQNTAPEGAETVIRSNVREVLLDVVVRHKDMTLAKKLKATDFTVTEDGVPQSVRTFRFVGGSAAAVVPAAAPMDASAVAAVATAQANTLREVNFVSIVFGEMSPDSRRNAIEAADAFLNLEFQTHTYAAIFGLNLRLNAVQDFTGDRALLRKAVARAVNGTSMELAHATADVLNQTTYTITGAQGGVSVNAGTDVSRTPDFATSGAAGAPLSEAQQGIAQMVSAQRDMVAYGEGMRVMTALLRLVEYQSKLPGRKTVLYLSEGLIRPPGNSGIIRQVISAANRGNISFYCVDVRGLTTATSNGTTAGLTASAAGISAGQNTAPSSPAAAKQQMTQEDLIADALSLHTQQNMAELAEGTGGFATFSTNQFKKNMARIMEDVRTHYEISYVPSATVYDGHFRQISVKVRDPKLTVQSRDGYFAMPEVNGTAVAPYELQGLRALQGSGRHDFEFRAAALRFKPLPGGFRYEMGFELETASLTTKVNPNTHTARIHGIFLALLKDAAGQVVGKVSQEVDRAVPEDKLDTFRRGKIIFTSPFEAATTAGRYTLDAVVTDPEGNRASTKRLSLVVPGAAAALLSSVAVVHEITPPDGPRDPGNPLEFPGGKVLPSLSQTGNAATQTVVFFVVYPQPGAEKPRVTVEFLRDGQPVAQTHPDVGIADEVNSLPLIAAAKLPAGEYVARVRAEQGERVAFESVAVTVRP